MATVCLQLLGVLAFLLTTLLIGRGIRRSPTKEAAQRLSRVSHGFFWGAMVVPEYLSVVVPGLTGFDALLGLPSLPFAVARWLLGLPMLLVGSVFVAGSIQSLRTLGSGLMAFKLTRQVVAAKLYARVRNPMSLGLYLQFIGIALVVGSTYLLLFVALLYVPAHAFNLKYFEELELSARYGPSYDEYKKRVPFLLPRPGPVVAE